MRLLKLVELGRLGTVQLGDTVYVKNDFGWLGTNPTEQKVISTTELLGLIDAYNIRLQSLNSAVKLKMDELAKIKEALNG